MAIGAAAVTAGGAVLSQGINAMATGKMNKKTRKWNEKMWNLQNDYNSPTKQMQRLREAGINPHSAYGHGTIANTAANPESWKPEAPQFDAAAISGQYFNTKQAIAQTDNLRAENTVKDNEAALKAAQTANTVLDNARGKFEFDKALELRDVSMDFQKESLRKLQADTQYQLSENQRRTALTSSNLTEAATRILQMESSISTNEIERARLQATIKNIASDTALKNLDLQLAKAGINRNDPMWARVLGQYLMPRLNQAQNTEDKRSGAGKLYDAAKASLKWFKGN